LSHERCHSRQEQREQEADKDEGKIVGQKGQRKPHRMVCRTEIKGPYSICKKTYCELNPVDEGEHQ